MEKIKKFEEFLETQKNIASSEITFQDEMEYWQLYEMSKVGEISNYTIFINSDDPGNIPHFHIIDSASYKNKKSGPWEFHTCLEIGNPKYFHHKSERKEDKINKSFAKQLISFLSSKKKGDLTNWDYVITLWNDNNSQMNVDEDTPIPDYTKIND